MTESAIYDVADRFGVDLEQVRRDHVISHVLGSISRRAQDRFIFYGGTALSRTWLPRHPECGPQVKSTAAMEVSGERRGEPGLDVVDCLRTTTERTAVQPGDAGEHWTANLRASRDVCATRIEVHHLRSALTDSPRGHGRRGQIGRWRNVCHIGRSTWRGSRLSSSSNVCGVERRLEALQRA